FKGRISNGLFSSNSPVTTKDPVSIMLQLPLVAGATPVGLAIIGAHLQARVTATGLMTGQINGAIKNTDVQGTIIPNVAWLRNTRVVTNQTVSTEKRILQIFDIGCTNAAQGSACTPTADCDASKATTDVGTSCQTGHCTAAKADGRIAVCEVADNSII